MKKLILVTLCLIISGGLCRAAETSPFAGKWKLDAARSSSAKPWETVTLDIADKGETLELQRHFTWSLDRNAAETIVVRPDNRTITHNPIKYWVESWFNNAYIGGDHQQHVKAGWLDRGRILRLDIDMDLELQQGDYPVHIYREYRLSADRNTLKIFELRSTRDQALTFIFTRA